MKHLLLFIGFCSLALSVFSQTNGDYSRSFSKAGFPAKVRNMDKSIDAAMHGNAYSIESAKLETGTDSITGYFGIIRINVPPFTLYTIFLAKRDSLMAGQLGFPMIKDTLNYLKSETDLSLSPTSKDKIHLSLKYDSLTKEVLYKWGDNNKNKFEINVDNVFKKGNDFPPLSIIDFDGNETLIRDLKNKIVVMNWWHTGCGPCIKEMPGLNELVDYYKEREDIIFIAIANNTKKELATFLRKKEFKYRQNMGTVKAQKILGGSYPQHIILGKDGKIAFYMAQGGENAAADIRREIEKLINTQQVNNKLFIEYAGEFNPINGFIGKIEKTDLNTSIYIKGKNNDQLLIFKNSAINKSLLSYIENGDMIDLKVVDNEKKVAIFKRINGAVKVKLFYVR